MCRIYACESCSATTANPALDGWKSVLGDGGLARYCPNCAVPPPDANPEWAMGFRDGVCDAVAGIVEPDGGYPESPLYRKGLEDGRRAFVEAARSIIISRPMPKSDAPPRRQDPHTNQALRWCAPDERGGT